jgi:hypothetical protein
VLTPTFIQQDSHRGGSALDAGSSAYWKALQPHRKLDEVYA